LFEAAKSTGGRKTNRDQLAKEVTSRRGGNLRSAELCIMFFWRCQTRRPHHLGLPIYIVRFVIGRIAVQPEYFESTIWCLQDYLKWEAANGKHKPGIRALLADMQPHSLQGDGISQAEFEQTERAAQKRAEQFSDETLEVKARNSTSRPAETRLVGTQRFLRNPYVREYVLRRANGRCERVNCKLPVPFLRNDGTTYLEVHHKIPLADDGPDTIENTVALCPNCHREAHYGQDWQKYRH